MRLRLVEIDRGKRAKSTYKDDLVRLRSLLLVTSLQRRHDLRAVQAVESFDGALVWNRGHLLIDEDTWEYVEAQHYQPHLVFCHPEVLLQDRVTALYYRGLCGLSVKITKRYVGAIENLEAGKKGAKLDATKALKMARTYNAFICSIINGTEDWTLENGRRTIIATLGITLDGAMRNKIGAVAEERLRAMIVGELLDRGLIVSPSVTKDELFTEMPRRYQLANGIEMVFSSEPDVSFSRDETVLAVIEIKGGVDAAGVLERYGAAKKSFEHSRRENPRCRNFYCVAVQTAEGDSRIADDSLVEHTFNIIDILENSEAKATFFTEVLHHALRLV